MKILIAEDQADNRQLIQDVLQAVGYDLEFARDGLQALQLARAVWPDLLILDINMPEMDGFEVCARLKRDATTTEIPILMLTALADIDDRVKGLGLGADDYLTKPFSPRELIARVNTRLHAKERTDQLKATQQRIRETFERFVAPQVVEALLQDPDKVRLGGQLQEVTVLFADLEGFTPLSEKIPPEQLLEILNRYHGLMINEIKRAGGTVDKLLGDGILALYNAPLPQEDHTLQAIQTALAVQAALPQLYETLEPAIRVKVNFGIHTGEAVVGNVGTADVMDYTAVGDTVNLASRLQGITHGGRITISQAAYERAGDRIRVENQGPQKVKGREEAVITYEVIALNHE